LKEWNNGSVEESKKKMEEFRNRKVVARINERMRRRENARMQARNNDVRMVEIMK